MSNYDPQLDSELYRRLHHAGPGAYWSVNPNPLVWDEGIVMVLAPCERNPELPLSIDRPLWQVSWTAPGVRGAEGRGATYQLALADLAVECPWPRALDTLGSWVQAIHHGHPSAQGPVLAAAL